MLQSTAETVYGASGLKKYAMLQIAHMLFASKGDCFQEESVEKPSREKLLKNNPKKLLVQQ
jgi:hypothetical protein